MTEPEESLYQRCHALNIAYHVSEHPAVFTVEESASIHLTMDGGHTKNLFLKDKRGSYWLITLPHDKRADLKAMAIMLGAGKFSFAKPDDMQALLGVSPGSVTPLAAIQVQPGTVTFVLDAGFDETLSINVHPLRNTATMSLIVSDMIKLIESFGHSVLIENFG